MHSLHHLDSNKWNTLNISNTSRSRIRLSDATTSKRSSSILSESKTKFPRQKFPIRMTTQAQSTQSAHAPYQNQTPPSRGKPPPMKTQIKSTGSLNAPPATYSHQGKSVTLKQLQEQMTMLDNWEKEKDTPIVQMSIIEDKRKPQTSKTSSKIDLFANKSNARLQESEPCSLLHHSLSKIQANRLNRLQTCFEDVIDCPKLPKLPNLKPKALKDSLNASISMTHLKELQNEISQSDLPKEFTTTMSNFIDILEIKSFSKKDQNITKDLILETVATQTETTNTKNEFSQVYVRVKDCTTQLKPKDLDPNLECQEFDTVISDISLDCENLVNILKMHEYRRNMNQLFGVQRVQPRYNVNYQKTNENATQIETKHSEVVSILENNGILGYNGKISEDAMFVTENNIENHNIGEVVNDFNNKELKTDVVDLERSSSEETKQSSALPTVINRDNIDLLNTHLTQVIQQLDLITNAIYNNNFIADSSNKKYLESVSNSDYITVDSGLSNSTMINVSHQDSNITTKSCGFASDNGNKQVSVYYSPVGLEHFNDSKSDTSVNLDKVIKDIDSSLGVDDDGTEKNVIQKSIVKVSAELVKILKHMKDFDEYQSKMKRKDNKESHRIKDRSDMGKSQSDVLVRVCRSENWTQEEDKEGVSKNKTMNKNNKWLSSRSSESFSTCTQISFADFESKVDECKDKLLPKDCGTAELVQKVLSNVSTNTDDCDLPNYRISPYNLCLSRYKLKSRKIRRRRLINFKVNSSQMSCGGGHARNGDYQISEYQPLFSTGSPSTPGKEFKHQVFEVNSQSPSVGNVKFVCKEFDKDSAVVINSTSSFGDFDAFGKQIKASCNSLNTLVRTTCVSTPYPETSLTNDSNETLLEDLTLNDGKPSHEMGRGNVGRRHLSQCTQSDNSNCNKTTSTDVSVQKNVSFADVDVQSPNLKVTNVGVQNQIMLTDKDVSTTEVFDNTTVYSDVMDSQRKSNMASYLMDLPTLRSSMSKEDDHQDHHRSCAPDGSVGDWPTLKLRTVPMGLDFDKDLVSAVKENCAKIPAKLAEKVMSRLKTTFKDADVDLNSICGKLLVDSSRNDFQVESVRCIGDSSVLIKWTKPETKSINGYEVIINNSLKAKIHSCVRNSAVVDFLTPKSTLFICVCALGFSGQVEKIAKFTFKMT